MSNEAALSPQCTTTLGAINTSGAARQNLCLWDFSSGFGCKAANAARLLMCVIRWNDYSGERLHCGVQHWFPWYGGGRGGEREWEKERKIVRTSGEIACGCLIDEWLSILHILCAALKVWITNISQGLSIFLWMMRNDPRIKMHPGIQRVLKEKNKTKLLTKLMWNSLLCLWLFQVLIWTQWN